MEEKKIKSIDRFIYSKEDAKHILKVYDEKNENYLFMLKKILINNKNIFKN
ncbi:hypothetical protein [Microcystis phage Mel-JY01]